MRSVPIASLVLAILIATAPTAVSKKIPVEEGPENGFGMVSIEPYPEYEGTPVRVDATVALKDFGRIDDMAHLMIAFNTHTTTLEIDFVSVKGPDGATIPIEQDQRDADALQPKVFLNTSDLPELGEPIRVAADVVAYNNGAYHLGVIAVAFDGAWDEMITDRGFRAEVYGFTYVVSHGQTQEPLQPPFEGRGNLVPAPGFVALGLALGAVAAIRRLRD